VPVRVTGIVKTAPWQALADELLIEALFARVMVVVADAAATCDRPVVSVKVTPVEELHEAPASEVMVPLPLTPVTVTGNVFELTTLMTTSPVPPGYSCSVVDAEASTVVRALTVPAFA
jgi:hypothetical protein